MKNTRAILDAIVVILNFVFMCASEDIKEIAVCGVTAIIFTMFFLYDLNEWRVK